MLFFQEVRVHPKALPGVKGSIGAPMPGEIIEIKVKEGDHVKPKSELVNNVAFSFYKTLKNAVICVKYKISVSSAKMQFNVNVLW